jgi:2-polyprenyl-3-methyl-5-hydroxy-6-metoxy-1,4-benzoquinol methylase
MSEIQSNKLAWSKLSKEHYNHFKNALKKGEHKLNPIIMEEIGDVSGKKILHLQCNTGADSILLAKMGADVTGVDLAPDNIHYAKKLAEDFGVNNVRFFASNVLEFDKVQDEKYDVVFTTEGVLVWLPDKAKWAQVIRHCLKDDGYLYLHDSHPFYFVFDEEKFATGNIVAKYPYFEKDAEEDDYIGGYASKTMQAKNYGWMYTVGEIINSLSRAGLYLEYFNEYDRCSSGMAQGADLVDEKGLTYFSEFEGKIPLVFSLKAIVK